MITGTLLTSPKDLQPVKSAVDKSLLNNDSKKSFIYIGDSSERTTKCLSFFDHCFVASNFSEATSLITVLYESNKIPDFIVVDLPLDSYNLSNFVLWLHTNKWSFMIPLLYNETALNERDLKDLIELSVADDIVNIEEYCNSLHQKASLLRNSKVININKGHETTLNNHGKTPMGKRIFDIVVSILLLITLAPLLLLIAIAIALESRGPVIYKSKRAGRGFEVFDFYKFRTMIPDADKYVNKFSELNLYAASDEKKVKFFKIKNDPRITRIGSILRNTSLDELPQLFNVLKGDMSIVGNRPLPLYEASTLTTNSTSERFTAPAGITGLWQVTKRGREEMDAEERVGLDINYARKQSFTMDCKILFQTPLALFQKSNV